MLLLAILSSGLIFLLRLNRQWLVLLLGLAVCCSSGCQGMGSVFSRKAEQNQIAARQWTNGGLEALDRGQLDEAQSCFNRALDLQPKDKRIRTHLANTHAKQGDYAQAIAHLQRVVETSNDPSVSVELGQLYLANRQWLPAMRQAEAALAIDRKCPQAWALKGRIQFSKGNYNDALANFQRALGLAPGLTDVHFAMAETYQQLGQPMRSLASLEQLLSRYPIDQQPEEVLLAKGTALLQIDQVGEAINLFTQTSQRPDATAECYQRLCQAQVQAGQISEARLTLNRAMSLFPEKQELGQMASRLQGTDRRVAMNAGSEVAPRN